MAKKVMDINQWQEFEIAIQRALPKDIDLALAQKWIEAKVKLPQVLREVLIVGQAKSVASAFTVGVDYTQSLTEMIKAGHYDGFNTDITAKHFPVVGSGQATVGLEPVHFGRSMSSQNVLTELDKRGLRPATLPELLAFGVKYPDEQRKYPIIALGSLWARWGGLRYVAFLRGDAGERKLNLDYFEGVWRARCRFLAASK